MTFVKFEVIMTIEGHMKVRNIFLKIYPRFYLQNWLKIKIPFVVKVISNVKFSALSKSVIKHRGYLLKKLIWHHLTFKVMVKVMIKVTNGRPPRNSTTFISKVFLEKPYFQRYSLLFFKKRPPCIYYYYY